MKNRLLLKLDVLRDLVMDDRGDDVLENGLNYLLCYERKRLEKELRLAREELQRFETAAGMDSRTFLRLYEGGEAEDRAESLEWFALLSLEVSLRDRLDLLRELLGAEEAPTAVVGERPQRR
jgi:hypothetical protein